MTARAAVVRTGTVIPGRGILTGRRAAGRLSQASRRVGRSQERIADRPRPRHHPRARPARPAPRLARRCSLAGRASPPGSLGPLRVVRACTCPMVRPPPAGIAPRRRRGEVLRCADALGRPSRSQLAEGRLDATWRRGDRGEALAGGAPDGQGGTSRSESDFRVLRRNEPRRRGHPRWHRHAAPGGDSSPEITVGLALCLEDTKARAGWSASSPLA